MSPVDDWATRHGWKIVAAVAGGAIAWAALSAQVNTKADKAEVEALRVIVNRIDLRTENIVLYLCTGHARDLGCQR